MNVPRMNQSKRRRLVKTGKSSGKVDTALRFLAVAKLGEGKTTPTWQPSSGLLCRQSCVQARDSVNANRIERVWQDLHANVTRNHRCRTMAKLLMKAKDYLDNYVSRRCLGW